MTDWATIYLKNKKNSLYNYASLMSNILSTSEKSLIQKKPAILKDIVNTYVDKHYIKKVRKIDIINLFIENTYITKFKLEKEAGAVVNHFIDTNVIFDIKLYEKDIILISVLLKMADRLDNLTNPFLKDKPNINNIVMEYINFYTKIDFIYSTKDAKGNTRKLIEEIKNETIKERKFFTLFHNQNSFNKYIRINEDNSFYISQYNYYIKDLEEFDPSPIKNIYEKEGIENNFLLISTELALLTLVKEMSVKKLLSTYLIPTKKSFFKENKNIKELSNILSTDISKGKIKLLINYNEIDNDIKVKLDENKIDYYIYCNKNSTVAQFNDDEKYLLSKEFNQVHQIKPKKNILLETINVFMQDSDILFLKNKEQNK